MKKLQLPALSNAKKLKRSELKNVFGGDLGSGIIESIAEAVCGNKKCYLYIQGDNGQWIPREGKCFPGQTYPHCFCNVGLGDVPLTSNGGSSRCN